MNEHPYLFIEPPTAEEVVERQTGMLATHPHIMLRVYKARGKRTTRQGGYFIALVNECPCRESLRVDPERPGLTRPRIMKDGEYCPMHDVLRTPLAATDQDRKTPQAAQKFLAKVFPNTLIGEDYVTVEAGPEFERLGQDTDLQKAVSKAEAWPGEPVRLCIIRCWSKERAAEIAKELRATLPWNENPERRPDGGVRADWHGMALTVDEQRLLKTQLDEDRAAKKRRRDRVIRDMQREAL